MFDGLKICPLIMVSHQNILINLSIWSVCLVGDVEDSHVINRNGQRELPKTDFTFVLINKGKMIAYEPLKYQHTHCGTESQENLRSRRC